MSLDNVKVGDVVVSDRNNHISKVTRVTKDFFFCGEIKYNKKHGKRTGDTGWEKTYVHLAEPGEIERIQARRKKQVLANNLRAFHFHTLPDDILNQIGELIGEKSLEKHEWVDKT